jgi:sarcosine oxidase, subunit delta
MLQIACPWCGLRDEDEFSCGGEAGILRPDPATASDEAWADYLYMRTNTRGASHERWCHSFGCRQWFGVLRDTVNHRIAAVYRFGATPPAGHEPVAGEANDR